MSSDPQPSNQPMKANGPLAKQLQRVCHRPRPWLISVSLGLNARMIFPQNWYDLVQRGMDRWRPGWRERAAKRKSPWDFVGLLLGFGLFPVLWYYFFRAAWQLHLYFYPAHTGHLSEFWGDGISTRVFVSSFLMAMPLFWPALTAALLFSNVVMWFIRPARRVMKREAAEDPEMTFRGANIGLLKWGGVGSAICFVLSFIGIATLRSLR